MSPRSTPSELSSIVGDAECDVLICDLDRLALVEPVARSGEIPLLVIDCDGALGGEWSPAIPLDRTIRDSPHENPVADDVAVISYTSGTTGRPKAAMLTHSGLTWAALSCARARGDDESTVGLVASALSHNPVFVSHVLARLLHAETIVMLERFDVPAILNAMDRWGVTDLSLAGAMAHDFLASDVLPTESVRACVRRVVVGGAATPMIVKERLSRVFPHASIIDAYGQTESTDGVAMTRGREVFERPGTVGRANPHIELMVVDSEGRRLPAGESGELMVGGPTVMAGYYKDPAETAKTIRDGYLRTGDYGTIDTEGHVFITGRLKNVIITGGENVAPDEVMNEIVTHPNVVEAVVVGTQHDRLGEQVTAVVVLTHGSILTLDELNDFLGASLAGFKKPRRLAVVDALPRTPSGKVHIAELRALFA